MHRDKQDSAAGVIMGQYDGTEYLLNQVQTLKLTAQSV